MNVLDQIKEDPLSTTHVTMYGWAMVALLAVGWLIRYAWTKLHGKTSLAAVMGFISAGACTGFAADSSLRYATNNLHLHDLEKWFLFSVLELALLYCIFGARQNMLSEEHSPGFEGTLAKFIVGVQIVPAWQISPGFGETIVRAVGGPILAMILWHRMLGIELKHRNPEAESMTMWAQIMREVRTRVFAYLGLARRDRTALEIIQDRYMDKAVDHERAIELLPDYKWKWYGRRVLVRLERKLDTAVKRGIGGDEKRQADYLKKLNERRGTATLRKLRMYDSWTIVADRVGKESYPEAHALAQQTATIVREGVDRAMTPPERDLIGEAAIAQLGPRAPYKPLPAPRAAEELEPAAPVEEELSPAKRYLLDKMAEKGMDLPPEDAKPFADIDPSLIIDVPDPVKEKEEPVKDEDEDPDPDPEPPAREPVPDQADEPARPHPVPPAEKPVPAPRTEPEPVKEPEPVGAGHDEEKAEDEKEEQKQDDDVEAVRTQAREAYKASFRAAAKPKDRIKAKKLGEDFGFGERWAYKIIAEAKAEMKAEDEAAASGRLLRSVK